MAANFAQMFEQQKPKKGKRKALIITNQPHAINATIAKIDYDRQGKWLKNMFGWDNVKIVLLNWADYRLFDGRRWPLVGDRMWDAAFEMVDCQSFGVDIRDTPFGVTTYKDPAYNGLQWQDVADGIFFINRSTRQCCRRVFPVSLMPNLRMSLCVECVYILRQWDLLCLLLMIVALHTMDLYQSQEHSHKAPKKLSHQSTL